MKKIVIIVAVFFLQFLLAPTATVSAELRCPVNPPFSVTSPFGEVRRDHVHKGVDIGIEQSTPIYSVADGVVEICGDCDDGYGGCIIIYHPAEDLFSLYAHNSMLLTYQGATVRKGQLIAYSGGEPGTIGAGDSTGPHLHFEIIPGSNMYGAKTDPGLYITDIMAAELGMIDYNPSANAVTLQIAEDFAKVLRDVINKTVELATTGLNAVKGSICQLFIVLLTIDLAWGAAWKVHDPNGNMLQWLIDRIVLYSICVFLITDWGSFVADFALEGFPSIGAISVGSTLEETGALLSDPSAVIQKGLNLVASLINEILSINSVVDIATISVNSLMCGIFGLIFAVLFFIIGIQLAMAYLQFYCTILLSFTGFLFSGLNYTRKYGANALNGVFVASINLMFYCMFAVMLNQTMENMTTAEFITQTKTEYSGVGTGTIQSQEQLLAMMRNVESYGGNYHCDNGLGYYGAYQINKGFWDGWCNDYMANRGNGGELDDDTNYTRFYGYGDNDTAPEPTNTQWPWSPRNQDIVARFITLGYYERYGSWEAAGRAWNQGENGMETAEAYQYQRALMGQGGYVIQKHINYAIILKLLLVVLLFMMMADRLSKTFMKQFGTPGFKLGNEQGGLGS